MKVHYFDPLYRRISIPLCRERGKLGTRNESEVTCAKCRKALHLPDLENRYEKDAYGVF